MQQTIFSYLSKYQQILTFKSKLVSRLIRLTLVLISSIVIGFVCIYLMVILIANLSFFNFYVQYFPQEKMKGMNILAFGLDDTTGVKRSDTIMVIHLDFEKNKTSILSIPRDTMVNIKGYGVTRINHAYPYGGTQLLVETVSNFIGLPIDYYFKIYTNGVADFIDHIGGVSLSVEKNMYYKDDAQNLEIDLKEGTQSLSGTDALSYIRFRNDNEGDIGRIRRQQHMVESMLKKLTSPAFILELPLLVRSIRNLIQTDMPINQMVTLAMKFNDAARQKSVVKLTVPGAIVLENGMSFWKPDIVQLDQRIKNDLLGFGHQHSREQSTSPISENEKRQVLSRMDVSRITDQMHALEDDSFNGIKLEILNGFGTKGAANKAANLLKEMGFIIARVDNASSFTYEDTIIVDWNRNISKSLHLSEYLRIDPNRIIVYDNYDKPIDFTLVLGKNWPRLIAEISSEHDNHL